MGVLIQLIADYAPYVYAACAVVALWYLRVAILARRERRRAIFSLEREAALNRIYNGFSVAFTLLFIMGLVYFISTYLARVVPPPELGASTPTATVPAFQPTPTPPPTVEPTPPTPTPTYTPRPRPTPRPTPPPPTPTAPQVVPPACPNAGVRITSPGLGFSRRGAIQVFGTANIENFQFYKLEFKGVDEASDFHYITGGNAPVVEGLLGVWDTSGLPAGAYQLRLVVVDKTGNFPAPCVTRIVVP
jgi:hypothetical protein